MRSDYRGKQVVVVGAGLSGCAMARFFLDRGARVVLSDNRSKERLTGLDSLQAAGVSMDLGGHSLELFTSADLVAISPGVPLTVPVLKEASEQGVPILGEVEVASRELEAPVIAITGTNGKSTVTTLTGKILHRWGKQAFVGGNLGTPLLEATGRDWDWLVVELSSFQLEAIEQFRPRYGLLLNVSEDHLDRYPDMGAYQAAKARLFENMTAEDVAVVNAEDPLAMQMVVTVAARRVLFSGSRLLEQGMGFDNDCLVWRWSGQEHRFAASELKIRGQHNIENVMAALIPPLLEGCPADLAWSAACEFAGLSHRMELVSEVNGVSWYDDSKGTNVGSVVKSLAGLAAPVTLIAGGKDKQGDLSPLLEPVQSKVRHLVLIGEAAERMADFFQGQTTLHRAGSMSEAVELAATITPRGGAVLLSPGCASFDMFSSYEERGRVFTKAVHELQQRLGQDHGS